MRHNTVIQSWSGLLLTILLYPQTGEADEPSLIRAHTIENRSNPVQSNPVEPKRVWINHVVIPWERLAHVAQRYGVTQEEIREWNQLPEDKHPLRVHMTLRIWAKKFPPPRNRLTHVVGTHDTWQSIAKRYKRTVEELKRWNAQYARRALKPETPLQVWMDSSLPSVGVDPKVKRIEPIQVPDGGFSVGRPSHGRLKNGVKLPKSELYTIRIPHHAYGTSFTIRHLQQAISDFRYQSGFQAKLIISDISRKRGRQLPPHRSHQSGRDVDIWLPAMPHARVGRKPDRDEVDWHAAWLLIKAIANTGKIKRIYLDRQVFKRLRRASKVYGVTWEEYRKLVGGSSLVWHQPGHDTHIHVRFLCSPQAERCKD